MRARGSQQGVFDGAGIEGIRQHLFAVLRDVVFVSSEIEGRLDLDTSDGVTDAVFQILRNAGVMHSRVDPNLR